jgi:hypothetical protein
MLQLLEQKIAMHEKKCREFTRSVTILSEDNGVIKKVVRQILSDFENSIKIPLEVMKCIARTRTFIQVRHMYSIM